MRGSGNEGQDRRNLPESGLQRKDPNQYEGYLSIQRRQREHDERVGLEQINKRAGKRESLFLQSFATHDINPMNSFVIRHAKTLAYVALESTHNTIFHFIETVKVRGQARNIASGDISHYFKN